jgi:alcohol oxidase
LGFFADDYVIDSTALLIGEKCAMLVAEDLGYSGEALEMKVPNYHAPGELSGIASLRL